MRKLISVLFFLICSTFVFPCTTVILSGKCTTDGRPLLYKHRDTHSLNNKVVFINGEIYDFIGVANSSDVKGDTIWMGTNSAGFSIMNSASYNFQNDYDIFPFGNEGRIMKRALETCATHFDFERLLDTLAKPLYVGTNFGVIDSYGGAAFYETNDWGYVKFDVNDSTIAPDGYLIRTNFSFTGIKDKGQGYIRYQTALELIQEALKSGKIDADFLLTQLDRCLLNSMTEENFMSEFYPESIYPRLIPAIDLIMRNSSASTFLCKGVLAGEDPSLNQIWVIPGYQLCTPAIPLWVEAGDNFPGFLKGDETLNAPLCSASLELKKTIYPITQGYGADYMALDKVINKEQKGIYQKIRVIEDAIFFETEKIIYDFYPSGFNAERVKLLYLWLSEFIKHEYYEQFGIVL